MKPSVIRIVAAVSAITALAWLVDNVNTHGDEVQRGTHLALSYEPRAVKTPPASQPTPATDGLDLIDMYECMCAAPIGADIKGWVGLWFVTLLVGGIPTAILLRFRDARPHRV